MPDRSLSPRELHQKAISVLDQLERLAEDARGGRRPVTRDVDVVTTAAAALRRRVEEAAAGPVRPGPQAVTELDGARRAILRALVLVRELQPHATTSAASRWSRRRDGDA